MSKQPKILLGVTGSIAAYKAAELVRLMKKKGWLVSVVMTKPATRFVGELTFQTLSQNPVLIDEFERKEQWNPSHVSLAEWADILVVAPCTANVIAKMAHGLADDAMTAAVLACRAPLVIAPAMNENMWRHPATQDNLRLLKRRGAIIVNPESGPLACGWTGAGRLAALETIMAAVEKTLFSQKRKVRR
jgi:phosphopantothenoylcysteine decarboxylase/phosphopantothenate--cysteine ligase